ncbi:RICIN domain-containing protein [Burkholderia ubonensis]|uniref:RICIN domain-containing protein n=1 Tax=Burkholderia ubonensis TaxID=101571 RepID=UPI000B246CEE|nr:RICIN domain-containing protein [Burkholderia ubonensis]
MKKFKVNYFGMLSGARKSALVKAFSIAGFAVFGFLSSGTASADQFLPATFKAVHDGQYISANGSAVVQRPDPRIAFQKNGFSISSQQHYLLNPVNNSGVYKIMGYGDNNLCLTASGASVGADVVRTTCQSASGVTSDKWMLVPADPRAPEKFHLVNQQSGFCANVWGGGGDEGAPIKLYPCQPASATNDQFTLNFVSGLYTQ